jgi:uncharacterized protein (TIGR02246 family)
MKLHICLLLAGLSAFLLSCTAMHSHSAPSSDPSQDPDLRRISAQWDRLYNAGDAAALAALYADDAVSMPPGSPILRGRQALQADFQTFFTVNTARHETTIDQIIRDGDLAIERAHYRLTFKPKSGGPEVVETGRHLECRKKINGTWQIVVEIWNLDPPPPK